MDIRPDLYRRYLRVRLAQLFPGWTFETIDRLSQQDILDILGVIEAQAVPPR